MTLLTLSQEYTWYVFLPYKGDNMAMIEGNIIFHAPETMKFHTNNNSDKGFFAHSLILSLSAKCQIYD